MLLSDRIIKSVERILGIKNFTNLQVNAFKYIKGGFNVLIVAPTGSGKTEAALLPVLDEVMKLKVNGIKALYITPLRALNRDIFRRVNTLCEELGIKLNIRHGDTPQSLRRKQAKSPPDILITTPETLQAILPGRIMQRHLANVRYIIIDEIHELIGSKRGVQLFLALERLARISREDFQRIGLSATVGLTDKIVLYLKGSSRRKTIVLEDPHKRIYVIEVRFLGSYNEDALMKSMLEDITDNRPVLLFTNTRDTAERLAYLLGSRGKGLVRIGVHHGSLSRDERIKVEREIKSGLLDCVVCTSSLELGLDIGYVNKVLQYLSPRRRINLIQRIGRSRHKLGLEAKGSIYTISVSDFFESLALKQLAIAGSIEPPELHDNALDILLHQIVGLILDENGEISIKEVYSTVKKCYFYKDLKLEEFLKLLKFAHDIGKLKVDREKLKLKVTKASWKYYFENISTIVEPIRFLVEDIYSRGKIGEVDENFVLSYCRIGGEFILGGKVWKVVEVDADNRVIRVEPGQGRIAIIPAWTGELIPVSLDTAISAYNLRGLIANLVSSGYSDKAIAILRRFGVPEEDCMKIVHEILDTIGKGYHIPAPNNIVIEDCQARNIVVIHVPLGTKGNLTLSLLIAGLIGEEYGITPLFNYTPYMIGLYLHRKLDVKNVMFRIFNLIRNMNERELLDIIARELRKTFTYKCRLINVAKRMGVIRRSQQFGKSISLDRLCRMLRDTPVDSETIREIIVEKLDINAIRWLKENLEKEKLKVVYMKVEDLNPISRDLFYSKRDIVLREIPTEQLLQVLKDRLLSSKVTLLCLSCFHIIDDIKIKYLGERPRCPKCGGLILGKAYSKEMAERVVKALKELKQGRKIRDKTLIKELKYVRETSELIAIYGRKALMILAGKGIGPEKAKKILFKASSEEEMLQLLIEAEKEYMRTRRFWHE